ncbi:MAG TPA: tetratricopeptide repeat protein, partial [Blastocatellia bacterium]
GAIEIMTQAVKSAGNPESAAWCRIHLGMELMNLGKMAEGERQFDFALQDLPGFYQALAAKARARAMAGDYDAAIQLYKESKERVPQPDTIMALGDLYASLGRMDDAEKEYEFLAIIERAAPDPQIYSRQMTLFWADHDQRLDEALETARQERAARSDIYSSDLLAWCLFKKNMPVDARKYVDEAMRLGAHDARIYYHAGMIYQALGERATASRYLTLALKYRISFDNSISSFGPLQERKVKEALEVLQAR